MSDKRDKPAEPDPEATVTIQRGSLSEPQTEQTPAADEDATVTLRRESLTEPPPDEDATVMMKAIKAGDAPEPPAPDEDSTVMMSPLKAEAVREEVAAMAPAPGARLAFPDSDPESTLIGAPPAPPPAAPVPAAASKMPWNAIAGGVVVLLVILYFVFSGGGKESAPSPGPQTAAAPAAPTPATAETAATAPAAEAPAAAPAAPATPAAAPAAAAAKTLLAGAIKRGQVSVSEEGGATTITFRVAQQFASGDVEPEPGLHKVLLEVAAVLDKAPGAIVVTGHADATPSTNKQFPSNQELSAARAAAAAKVMATKLHDPKRIRSEGASDAHPVAPNDTAANRAKNRRVVVVLKPAA